MSPINASDLPKSVRDKLGIETRGRSSKPSRAGVGDAALCPGICGECGARFDRYSAFEAHLKAEHPTSGVRWTIELPS